VLANGAIPVTSLKRDAAQPEVLASRHGRWIDAGLLQGLTMNGRGLAAADYDNDGRVDIAVGSIGGKLLLLHNKSPGGHWLTVAVKPFSPGAQVIVLDSHGRAQEDVITAGSSYLSSEDPRAHFGFGSARPVRVTVRYPNGTVRTAKPRTNSLLTVVR
jgi:hypothetical protein